MKKKRISQILTLLFCITIAGSSFSQYDDPMPIFSTPLAGLYNYKIIDYNYDGILDIVANTGESGGHYVYFIKGSASGLMLEKSCQIIGTGEIFELFDFDNDGDIDIFSKRRIFENNNFEFSLKTSFPDIYDEEVLLYDMDNDGFMDIIPGLYIFSNDIEEYPYLRNQGNLNFELVGDTPALSFPSSIDIIDIDNDGRKEIILVDQYQQIYTLTEGNSVEPFEFQGDINSDKILIGDVDGNGTEDIIAMDKNSGFIIVHFYNKGVPKQKIIDLNIPLGNFLLYDHNQDGIKDILIYGNNTFFMRYNGEEFVVDDPLPSTGFINTYLEIKILELNNTDFFICNNFNSLYIIDIQNGNAVGTPILEDFTFKAVPITYTNDNSKLGYNFIDNTTLKTLFLDPVTKAKILTSQALLGVLSSIALVEIEDGKPVYILNYENNNGLYIVNANDLTALEIDNPKFTFTNVPRIVVNKIGNEVSVIIMDGLDIYNLTYDNDYTVNYLRDINYYPKSILQVDLNNDGIKELVSISSFEIMYATKQSNGYGDFVKLFNSNNNYIFKKPLFFDYNNDGNLDIVGANSYKFFILSINENFSVQEDSYDIEFAFDVNFAGGLNDNTISLLRTNGHHSLITDIDEFVNTQEADQDIYTEPHHFGYMRLRDIDLDGDNDILITNNFTTSLALNGTISSTNEQYTALAVYPNPTCGIINFKTDKKTELLAIYDVNGNVLPIDSDLSHHPAGIYFLKVLVENKIETISIIKSQN